MTNYEEEKKMKVLIVFDGWYTEDGDLFDFTRDRITERTTLYDKWSRDWSLVDDHVAYIVGYPDGMVHPNDNITRAEFATIVVRFDHIITDTEPYFVYMTAGQNKSLRIYYARVKECLTAFDARRDSEN